MGINDKLEFREIVQTFTEENFPSEIDEYIQFFQDWKKEYAHLYSRIEVEYGIAALCRDLDINMEDVAKNNLIKLIDRQTRNVIQGSGDKR